MIDHSDVDDVCLAAWFVSGWWVIVLILLALVFWYVAETNEKKCSAKTCPDNTRAVLMEHSCLCVMEAK